MGNENESEGNSAGVFFFQCINSQSALKKMNASRKLFIIERLHNASMNQNKQAEKLIKKGTCLRELYTLL